MGQRNSHGASSVDRRRFLRSAGAVGATFGAGALAGCTGGGDGSDGADGGSDGGDGDGGTGGQTDSGDGSGGGTIRIGLPPVGIANAMVKRMEESGNLQQYMDDAGYDFDLQQGWDNPTLYVSGQLDMMMANPMELARMGTNQGTESVSLAGVTKLIGGITLPAGSEYSASETGSIESSVQAMAEDNVRFGFDGWSSGDIPFLSTLFGDWGVNYTPTNSDFEMIDTEAPTIGNMLANGELAAANYAPYLPGYISNIIPEINLENLFIELELMDELGYSEPLMLAGLGARQESFEQDRDGYVAFARALSESVSWMLNNVDAVKGWDDLVELSGRETQQQAEFLFDWNLGSDLSSIYGEEYAQWELPSSTAYESAYMSDELISVHQDFLDTSAEGGFVTSDWADYVSFAQLDELN